MENKIIIYSLLSFALLYLLTKISYKLNLIDFPNKRKIHLRPTAFTGGIIIGLIFLFALKGLNIFDKSLAIIISVGFLISLVGLIDDKFQLNVGGKLSLQIIPIFYLIVYENLFLNNLGDYDYFFLELGSFSAPFTLLSVLFLINSFNYFDGIDGSLSFGTISILAILFYLVPDQNFRLFLMIILIPLVIFLCFNFSLFRLPKLFLGDSGSLLLGFIVSFLLIYLANKQLIHPILLAWSIAIFVYEFLSVNIIRLKSNRNLFLAGTDHLHHELFNKTKSTFFTNFFMISINFTLFLIGYFSFLFVNKLTSLILYIVFFLIYLFVRNFYLKVQK